jgi:hypothetical protein
MIDAIVGVILVSVSGVIVGIRLEQLMRKIDEDRL